MGAACPFAIWFPSADNRMTEWSDLLVEKYTNTWENALEVDNNLRNTPYTLNDHNYGTLLGQGNTKGFVAAKFVVHEDVPIQYKVGLLKVAKEFPALIRFSDFGADGSFQLDRAAIKIQTDNCGEQSSFPDPWLGEINLLFTESMDSFPLADYENLKGFATSKTMGLLSSVAEVGRNNALSVLRGKFRHTLTKHYYSQLPYALGPDYAMKFRLVPTDEARACFKNKHGMNIRKMRFSPPMKGMRSLCDCEMGFRFEIQVIPDHRSNRVMKRASSSWHEPYIHVASVIIPKQAIDESDGITSNEVRSILSAKLTSDSAINGIHKLFYFHPIATCGAHRPLGEINSFRSYFYSHHAHERFQTILKDKQALFVTNEMWVNLWSLNGEDAESKC
jgi:hypothetical protein